MSRGIKRNFLKKSVRYGTNKWKKVFVNMWEVDNVEETVHIVADWKVESNQNCDGKRINCSFVIYIT